jgi:hypothetical protein
VILVTAEVALDLICRSVELDPLNVDVIIRRYEAASSEAAILVETGTAFTSRRRGRSEGPIRID